MDGTHAVPVQMSPTQGSPTQASARLREAVRVLAPHVPAADLPAQLELLAMELRQQADCAVPSTPIAAQMRSASGPVAPSLALQEDESSLAQTVREELAPGGDLVESLKRLRNLNREAALLPVSEQPDGLSVHWARQHNKQLVERLQLERTLHTQLDQISSLERGMDDAQRRELGRLRKKADEEEAELAEAMAQLTHSFRQLRADAVAGASAKLTPKASNTRESSAQQAGETPDEPRAASGSRDAARLNTVSRLSFKMDLPPPPPPTPPKSRSESLSPPANLEHDLQAMAAQASAGAVSPRRSGSGSGSPLPHYLQAELQEAAQKMLCPDGATLRDSAPALLEAGRQQLARTVESYSIADPVAAIPARSPYTVANAAAPGRRPEFGHGLSLSLSLSLSNFVSLWCLWVGLQLNRQPGTVSRPCTQRHAEMARALRETQRERNREPHTGMA